MADLLHHPGVLPDGAELQGVVVAPQTRECGLHHRAHGGLRSERVRRASGSMPDPEPTALSAVHRFRALVRRSFCTACG
ncbi:hypothetical protein KCMC57_up25150 [Kitasatospora sp. CMC57]